MLALLLACQAVAKHTCDVESDTDEELVYTKEDDAETGAYFTVKAADADNLRGSIEIPATHTVSDNCKDIPVLKIEESGFAYAGQLSAVTLNDGLLEIGDRGFMNAGMQQIEMPNSVTTVGLWAFSHCTTLTKIKLSDSLTGINLYMFQDARNLYSIEIPARVVSIHRHAFRSCGWLTTVKLSSALETMSQDAFQGCVRLRTLTFPPSFKNFSYFVTSLGGYGPFVDCTLLTELCFCGDGEIMTQDEGAMPETIKIYTAVARTMTGFDEYEVKADMDCTMFTTPTPAPPTTATSNDDDNEGNGDGLNLGLIAGIVVGIIVVAVVVVVVILVLRRRANVHNESGSGK